MIELAKTTILTQAAKPHTALQATIPVSHGGCTGDFSLQLEVWCN
jgi:hypothetical protein